MAERWPAADKKPFLPERIYKSRISRALALAGSLMFLGQFAPAPKARAEKEPQKIESAEKILNIGESAKKFHVRPEREGETYLVHIGQIHSDVRMETTRRTFDQKFKTGLRRLIENQKNIETLLLELRDKRGINNFYLENTPSAWSLDALVSLHEQLAGAEQSGTLSAIKFLEAAYENVDEIAPADAIRAPVLYFLHESLRKHAAVLERSEPESGGAPSEELSHCRELTQKIRNENLIRGDNVYIWGAALKLFAEDKINLLPAETGKSVEAAIEKAFELELYGDAGVAADENEAAIEERIRASGLKAGLVARQKDFLRKKSLLANLREDYSLGVVAEDMAERKQKFYPLIYGVAHDFADNVEKYNTVNGTNIGLINVFEK